METLRQPFVERSVAEPLQLGLFRHILGHVGKARLAPGCRDRHHPRGGDAVPFGERSLGRFVELSGDGEVIRFLEPAQRVLGAHVHLAVDDAGTEAHAVEHDLRLHDRALFGIGNVGRLRLVARRIVVRCHRIGVVVRAIGLVADIVPALSAGDAVGILVLVGPLGAAGNQGER